MTEFLKLGYEEWVATYAPIDNQFNPNVAGGKLFEIPCNDEEKTFLRSVEASKIWNYGSGEYGGTYIWSGESGQGLENYGAYVAEIGYEGDTIIEVELSEAEYTCPNCEVEYAGELAVEQRKKYEDECEECGTIKSCINCGAECSNDDYCECGYDDWFNGTEKWELIKESFIAKYGEPS